MKTLMMSTALCTVMAATSLAAQTVGGDANREDVFRNDLPETHTGAALPPIDGDAPAELAPDLQQAIEAASSGALSAQQFGILATTKNTSGVVRDLGDVMVLLNRQTLEQLDTASGPAGLAQTIPPETQPRLDALGETNGSEFALGLATWVREAYPDMIAAWQSLGKEEAFAALSEAVLAQLEAQRAVAEEVVTAGGELQEIDEATARTLSWGGAPAVQQDGASGPTGEAGQTGERQHTPEPEAPAVQSGENYRQEQVEIDPQTQTRSLPDQAGSPSPAQPAGEFGILNAAGLFAAMANPQTEIAQLETVSGLSPEAVRVVPVEQAFDAATVEEVRASMTTQEGAAALRQAVEGASALREALEAAGAATEEVVAFDVLDEGVVLYTLEAETAQSQ